MAKRRLSPEQRAELAEFDARSLENLRRLRELAEKGLADLESRRSAQRDPRSRS